MAAAQTVRSGRSFQRGEGQWYLWLARILFASTLLLKHKHAQQVLRPSIGCPAAVSTEDFWSAAQWFALMYFMVDFGSCCFFACSSIWIRQSLSHCGRSLSCLSALLASWGFFAYVRAFAFDLRCVGIFGVIAMLCFFVFVVSTVIWWLLVECDACQLEATGLGDDDSGSCALMANPLTWGCCRLFSQLCCSLEAWPSGRGSAEDLAERGDASPHGRDTRPSPSPDTSTSRGMRGSPIGSSGGSKDNEHKITFRVLGRNGELLFASRSKQTVRTWIKRNLDREKRKGVIIEEKRRSSRRSLKRLSPSAQGRNWLELQN